MVVSMTTVAPSRRVGELLRDWRQRRRLSQLGLAVEAEVSARHLSFVETGRSRPSRELVLHLAEHLDVPLRERNDLLLAAGYAPVYQESSLDAAEMAPVRAALDKILGGHEPFPAVVVDRHWNIVTANRAALEVITPGVAPALLAPPINAYRVSLHPDGLAARIANFGEYSAHLMARLHRQIIASADPELSSLYDEMLRYPGVSATDGPVEAAEMLFVPLVLRSDDGDLTFFSTVATFGTALDVTMAELAVESFFPADAATERALRASAAAG